MERVFRAEKMLKRVHDEGLEEYLDDGIVELIHKLDGKVGQDYNWESFINDNPLVWISGDALPDEDFEGTYVALCDCD